MKQKISEKEMLEKIEEQVDEERPSCCSLVPVPPDEGEVWDVGLSLSLKPGSDCEYDAYWDEARAVLASLLKQYEIVPDPDRGGEA